MIVLTLLIFLQFFYEITCVNIVSSEKDYINEERKAKYTSNSDLKNRRFNQDLDDDEWHVAHLKDTDFSRRSECEGDTLQDKVSKYRKTLKNDGALVEFVSADPLPFNTTDLETSNSCQKPNNHNIFLNIHKPKTNAERDSTKTGSEEKSKTDEKEKTLKNGTVDEVRTATTAKVKQSLRKDDKVRNKTESRRTSEYQFSSVEYYDEVAEFDELTCPDDIEVIILQVDQLRNYDVECELILEWRSLE